MSSDPVRLRSYRLAFQLERRIHRIDRFRIPVPYGLPLAGVGWWAATVLGILLLRRLPVIGPILAALPWPIEVGLLPAAAAWTLCLPGPDSRPAHERLVAWITRAAGPRIVLMGASGSERGVTRLHDLVIAPDERTQRLRPAVIRGPIRVLVRRPLRGRRRGARLAVSETDDRWLLQPQPLDLGATERLEVTCARR